MPAAGIMDGVDTDSAAQHTKIGVIVGSVSSGSINQRLANALPTLAPEGVAFTPIPLHDLPVYARDWDAGFPPAAVEFKRAIERSDGILILTPEYLRSIPGVLKNALDWASRPSGKNSFDRKPAAIAGVSPGPLGTAAAQQHLRNVLAHLNAPTMGQPEMFLRFDPEAFPQQGGIADASVRALAQRWLDAAVAHIRAIRTRVP